MTTIVLPFELVEDTDADAAQVVANFKALVAAIEGIGIASAAADAYQAGVIASTDWKASEMGSGASTVTGGTGAIKLSALGGAVWLPGPSGALVRCFVGPTVYTGLKPPVLPLASGYRIVGVELTASGAEAVVSLVSGAEKSTLAKAIEEATPATTSGKTRIMDIGIKNNAGTYEDVQHRDRRPWALGARAVAAPVGELSTASTGTTPIDTTHLALRVECSGRPVRVVLRTSLTNTITGTEAGIGFREDGADISGEIYSDYSKIPESVIAEVETTPPAGSHLFLPTWLTTAGTLAMPFVGGGTQFLVEEVRPAANNGVN